MVMGSTPRTGRTEPSSDSSPSSAVSCSASGMRPPLEASMPTAMGRSKAGPSFFWSAGARFTVSRPSGKGKPLFRRAVRTRSRDSLTAASGRPTRSNWVMPRDRFTSTRTGNPSIPLSP